MDILIFINNLVILFLLIFIFLEVKKYKEDKNIRNSVFKRYPEIIGVLESSKQVAFDQIWNKLILVQMTSGYTTEKKDLSGPIKNYIKLVYDLCGPSIIEDLNIIYGNPDCLISRLTTQFINEVRYREIDFTTKTNYE
jgi:hypothetical protein